MTPGMDASSGMDPKERLAAVRAAFFGLPAVMPEIKPSMLVTLVVQDTKRRTLSRTMRTTDKLQDLMDHYYDVMSTALTYGEGRFLFDGGRVNGEKTPEDYDMVSGDKIDFFPELMGA